MMELLNKCCYNCAITKPVNEFRKRKGTSDGYQYYCKTCQIKITQNWQKNNRDRYNWYFRNRTANNIQHKISAQIHSRLRKILYRGSYTTKTEEILGCSKTHFLDWISFQFEGSMCFSNYGKVWHFDLVNPASNFDLTCNLTPFNWTNIRPCYKKDNGSKYNFVLPFYIINQNIRVLAFEMYLKNKNVI